MKHILFLPLLAIVGLLGAARPAQAIIIEDSAARLEFEVFWGPTINHEGGRQADVGGTGSNTGSGGSTIHFLANTSSNPNFFLIEINRMINGLAQPVIGFGMVVPSAQVTFTTLYGAGGDHLFPIDGNPQGARWIIGEPHADASPLVVVATVPDSGSTFGMLAFVCCAGFSLARRRPVSE